MRPRKQKIRRRVIHGVRVGQFSTNIDISAQLHGVDECLMSLDAAQVERVAVCGKSLIEPGIFPAETGNHITPPHVR